MITDRRRLFVSRAVWQLCTSGCHKVIMPKRFRFLALSLKMLRNYDLYLRYALLLAFVIVGFAVCGCAQERKDKRGCTLRKVVATKAIVGGLWGDTLHVREIEMEDGHIYRLYGNEKIFSTASEIGVCDVVSKRDGSHHYALHLPSENGIDQGLNDVTFVK